MPVHILWNYVYVAQRLQLGLEIIDVAFRQSHKDLSFIYSSHKYLLIIYRVHCSWCWGRYRQMQIKNKRLLLPVENKGRDIYFSLLPVLGAFLCPFHDVGNRKGRSRDVGRRSSSLLTGWSKKTSLRYWNLSKNLKLMRKKALWLSREEWFWVKGQGGWRLCWPSAWSQAWATLLAPWKSKNS